MLKIEKIKKILYCPICKCLLEKPVFLSCGEIVCNKHVADMQISGEKNIRCILCQNLHAEEFHLVKAIEKVVAMEETSQDRLSLCKKLNEEIKSIESAKQNSENIISEHFRIIKERLRFEQKSLQIKIDSYYKEILEGISRAERTCRGMEKTMNELTDSLNKSKMELEEIKYEKKEVDDTELLNLKSNITEIGRKFSNSLKIVSKISLAHEFRSVEAFPEKLVFGTFVCPFFTDSKILSLRKALDLRNLCEFESDQKWRLIYRASDNGFQAENFHENCDGKKNTLTILKTTTDCIFGGYTSAEWTSNGSWNSDPTAFLFNLTDKATKAKCSQPEQAILCNANHGPIFGRGDLLISDQSNVNFLSNHRQNSYVLSDGSFLFSDKDDCFQTTEIEVYCKS